MLSKFFNFYISIGLKFEKNDYSDELNSDALNSSDSEQENNGVDDKEKGDSAAALISYVD